MTRPAVMLPSGNEPLILSHAVKDIVGAAVKEDLSAVALTIQTDRNDRVILGMTPGGLDAMLESLQKLRAQLDDAGVERSIPFQPVHTVTAGVHVHDNMAFVALLVDRSLPSAQAYLMAPKAARVMSRALKTAAQQAASARGEVVSAEEE
jgi:hypothetical protein